MTRDLTRKTLGGAAWIGGASVVRLGLRVIAVAILARLLTPREYGIAAGAALAMELSTIIYTLGLAQTLIQRNDIRPDHVATAFSSSLILAIGATLGMWLAAPSIANLMQISELDEVIRVLALMVPLGAFNTLCEAVLARNMQAKSLALRPLLSYTAATFLVAIPLAFAGFSYWALVALQASETILTAAAFAIMARKFIVWPGFSRQAFIELWPMSVGFTLNSPFVVFAGGADTFLIARLIGADALGLYSRASFITTAAGNIFANIARTVIFPAMSSVQFERNKLRKAFNTSISLIATTTIPSAAFCFIFSNEIVELLLGAQWITASMPLSILAPMLHFRIAIRNIFSLFHAIGSPYISMAAHGLQGVLLIICLWMAAPFGFNVVCVAVVCATAAVYMFLLRMVHLRIALLVGSLTSVYMRPMLLGFGVIVFGRLLKEAGLTGVNLLIFGSIGTVAMLGTLFWSTPRLVLDQYCLDALHSVPRIRRYISTLKDSGVTEKDA